MYRPPPSETGRRTMSGLFNRLHGEPIERPPAAPREPTAEGIARNRVEDLDEARRLKRETDWLAE